MDVYEELGRLAETHKEIADEAQSLNRCYEHTGKRWSYDHAQRLVDFLRWRDPAKEWPADSCRCLIVAEFPGGGVDVDRSQCMEHSRAQAVRWRYILGPCTCGTAGTEGA